MVVSINHMPGAGHRKSVENHRSPTANLQAIHPDISFLKRLFIYLVCPVVS
ncbi:hypothetical protein D1BOALGB6SA_5055 [Olavius sp. associated proteobacterium Delta 1]|nr:hypothetical protein D1BOALGB6SA_5055 [Olavius sp. associated proteobacterium Delta 1]